MKKDFFKEMDQTRNIVEEFLNTKDLIKLGLFEDSVEASYDRCSKNGIPFFEKFGIFYYEKDVIQKILAEKVENHKEVGILKIIKRSESWFRGS